jgi:hypothetical protein
VIDGIHTRFTQCGGLNCSVLFEGSDHILVQNSSFGHVANSDDNSYAIGLWETNGSIIRDSRFFDSAYWGGVPNSKGVTFMISGAESPNWVCNNEIFHIPGWAAVASKGGVSHINILGNYIHDCHTGVRTDHFREQDGVKYEAGDWRIQQNVFEHCQVGVDLNRNGHLEDVLPDLVVNNVFSDNWHGVRYANSTAPGERVLNNAFIGGDLANMCIEGACGAALYFSNDSDEVLDFDFIFEELGCQSSHNSFWDLTYTHGVTRTWSANYANYTLEQLQQAWQSEEGSLAADPMLGALWKPAATSPLLGAGLGEPYDVDTVSIGLYPFVKP